MGRGAAGCCGLCDCCDAKAVQVGEKGVFKRSEDRHCTDILFFLLYWAGWAIIAAIFISASAAGADINRVTRGTDFDGNICGKTDATAGRPYTAWPYPEAYAVQVCVSNCNFTQTDTDYMLFNYPSTKFMYWCIPGDYNTTKYVTGLFDTSSYDSSGAMATRAMGDMYTAWPVILISAGVALALSYFYIWISKYAGKCFVWLVILLILGAGVLLGVALWVKAADVEKLQTDGSAKAMKILAGIVWGVTGVFFLIIVFLRDRINIAIEVVRQAGEAIEDMKLIICFPIIPFMFGCLYIFFWCVLTFYLFTVGDLNPYVPMPNSVKTYHDKLPTGVTLQGFQTTTRVNYTRFDWNESYKGALAMNLFHMLWNVQFIIYFCYLTSAGAIANWYFSRPPKGAKETDERERGDGIDQLPRNAVTAAACRTCRFHWGTVAFGAFIIALIQFIRMVVTYIEKKTQARTNNAMKCVYCLIQCCLKCLQCCMDKVSKNAFVWTAIWGDNFVTAACSSFALLWSNMARVAAINLVSSFLMMLGRVLVALATTGVCGFIIRNIYGDEISSLVMPLVVILVLSFMVASLFMIVVETTIDTIFLCVLIDESLKRDGYIHYWSSSMERLINGKEVSERSQRIAKERNEQNELRKQGGHNRNAPPPANTATPTPLSPTGPVSAGPGATNAGSAAGGLQVGVSVHTPAGGPTFAAVATASPAAGGAYPTIS